MEPVLGTRKVVRIMVWFLKSIGLQLPENGTSKCYSQVHAIISIFPATVVLLTTSIYAYLHKNDIEQVTLTGSYIGGGLFLHLATAQLYRNQDTIKSVLEKIDRNVYTYSDDAQVSAGSTSWILHDGHYTKKLLYIYSYTCFGFSLNLISLIVQFYVVRDLSIIRIYPSWYPWNGDSLNTSVLIISWQFFTGVVVFWYYYFLQAFLFLFITEILRQKNKLCVALVTLPSRTKSDVLREREAQDGADDVNSTWNEEVVFENKYCGKVIECIKHYQEILKTFDLLNPVLTFIFTTELVLNTMTLSSALYSVIEFPKPEMILTLLGAGINLAVNLFSRCMIGEMLSSMDEDIKNNIFYDVSWYEQSTGNKRLLSIFHLLAMIRKTEIIAFSVFPASKYTFGGLMRMSYSYMGLIKASLARKTK